MTKMTHQEATEDTTAWTRVRRGRPGTSSVRLVWLIAAEG
jgi:hypothetical protein